MKKQYQKEIEILHCDSVEKDEHGNPKRINGFVRYIDHMGDDAAIVQAARVSYGAGTKSVREDRGLLRYLMRHQHSTPYEMCELKIHCKVPIFVGRQSMRHRTMSFNEYSGRYSVMDSDCYIPEHERLQPQSKTNKQGSDGELSLHNKDGVKWLIEAATEMSLNVYNVLLGARDEHGDLDEELIRDTYQADEFLDFDEFEGLSRELARGILPVSNFTQFYMKGNLWNFMRFVSLRSDSHAQWEIQEMSNAIKTILIDLFPDAMEAFYDYREKAVYLSRQEKLLLDHILNFNEVDVCAIVGDSQEHFANLFGMSKGEIQEFIRKF